MAEIQYGYIAHGAQGFWFQGPLPSPKCARLLAQFHGGIDIQEIPPTTREHLNERWQLQPGFPALVGSYPDRGKQVKWAISLESIVAEAPDVKAGLKLVETLQVPVFGDTGPYFGETPADAWTGADC
jgi:hypothetical protein